MGTQPLVERQKICGEQTLPFMMLDVDLSGLNIREDSLMDAFITAFWNLLDAKD